MNGVDLKTTLFVAAELRQYLEVFGNRFRQYDRAFGFWFFFFTVCYGDQIDGCFTFVIRFGLEHVLDADLAAWPTIIAWLTVITWPAIIARSAIVTTTIDFVAGIKLHAGRARRRIGTDLVHFTCADEIIAHLTRQAQRPMADGR